MDTIFTASPPASLPPRPAANDVHLFPLAIPPGAVVDSVIAGWADAREDTRTKVTADAGDVVYIRSDTGEPVARYGSDGALIETLMPWDELTDGGRRQVHMYR